ncbi:hypothetical protein GCM10025331_68400 [Actinoplanes utahensis]|nr:hypothetical protein Aut01nite_00720 [Actinoplanes utahensis]
MIGWRWLDRRLHRVAGRLTEAQFAALAERSLKPGRTSAARMTTLAAAFVLLIGVLTVAALGLWLLVTDFFTAYTVLGAVLIGVAFVLRPRLGSLADLTGQGIVIDPGQAPALFALVQRVATTVGAPMPQVLVLGYDLNAFTTAVGMRRTRVLCIGLPLWAALEPQEKVALLGHELGHFVNGDVRRGPLTQVAETTLDRVAHLLDPEETSGEPGRDLTATIAAALGRFVSAVARGLQLLLVWTSLRDSQRAEYLADETAARAGGTDAAVSTTELFLMTASIDTVIRREARAGNAMPAWRDAARAARANSAASLPLLRRLTRHTEASLHSSHPPTGLRAEMLERRPRQAATVTLTESEAARVDAEVAVHERKVLRELAY